MSRLWKVVAVTSLIVMSIRCIIFKVSKQHHFYRVQRKADMITSSVKKCLKFLQLVDCDQFSPCKCRELQLYKADSERLCSSLRDTYRLSAITNSLNAIK